MWLTNTESTVMWSPEHFISWHTSAVIAYMRRVDVEDGREVESQTNSEPTWDCKPIQVCYFVPHFYVSTNWFHFTTASRSIAAVLREREEHWEIQDTSVKCILNLHLWLQSQTLNKQDKVTGWGGSVTSLLLEQCVPSTWLNPWAPSQVSAFGFTWCMCPHLLLVAMDM